MRTISLHVHLAAAVVGVVAMVASLRAEEPTSTPTTGPAASGQVDKVTLTYGCSIKGVVLGVTSKKNDKPTDILREKIASLTGGSDAKAELSDKTTAGNLSAFRVASGGKTVKFRPDEVTAVEMRSVSLDAATPASQPSADVKKSLDLNTKLYNSETASLRDQYKKALSDLNKNWDDSIKSAQSERADLVKQNDQLKQTILAKKKAADRMDDAARRSGRHSTRTRLRNESDKSDNEADADLRTYNQTQAQIDKLDKTLAASEQSRQAAQGKLAAWSVANGTALGQVSDKHALIIRAGGQIDENQMKSNFEGELASTPSLDAPAVVTDAPKKTAKRSNKN